MFREYEPKSNLNQKWKSKHQESSSELSDLELKALAEFREFLDAKYSNKEPTKTSKIFENILFVAVTVVYLGVIGYITLSTAIRKVGSTNAILVGVLIILMTGVILYIFRKKSRALYGFFEIISALFLGGITIARAVHFNSVSFIDFLYSSESFSTLLGFASAIYIVVRGLDNMAEAKKAKSAENAENTADADKSLTKE